MTPINEDFMIGIRLKEAISGLHRIYLNVSAHACNWHFSWMCKMHIYGRYTGIVYAKTNKNQSGVNKRQFLFRFTWTLIYVGFDF